MVYNYNKHRIRNTCYIARKLRNMTYAARKNSICNQVKKQLFAFCSVGLKLRAISYSSLSSCYRLQTSNSFAYRLMMESGPTTTSVVGVQRSSLQLQRLLEQEHRCTVIQRSTCISSAFGPFGGTESGLEDAQAVT